MTVNLLEELEIPHPPYRMARPVARLVAEEMPSDEERARQEDERRRAEEEASWKKFGEQLATPEQIDLSVDAVAEKAIVQASPKSAEIIQAQQEYRQQVGLPRHFIRTPEEVASEALKEIIEGRRIPSRMSGSPEAERSEMDQQIQESEHDISELKENGLEGSRAEKEVRERIEALKAQRDEIVSPNKKTEKSSSSSEINRNRLESLRPSEIAGFDVEHLKREAAEMAAREEKRLQRPEPLKEEPKSAPAEVPVPVAHGYDAELERVKAKQAELRAAGKAEEAAKYDESIAKYEAWKKEQEVKPDAPSERPLPEEPVRTRKEEIALKSAITKAQTAAIKENKMREASAPDESLDILREAHEGKGPVPQSEVPEQKEPQEDVLDVLREGQTAQTTPEHMEGPDFSGAQSFDQLHELLIAAEEIVGTSGKTYKANALIGDITDIRDLLRKENGDLLAVQGMLRYITPAGGLREKVRELLEQEAASLSTSPEGATPVVEPVLTEEEKWRPTRITPEEQATSRATYERGLEDEKPRVQAESGGEGPPPPAEHLTRVEEEPEPSGAEEDLEKIPGIKEMGEDHPPRWWDRVGLNVERSQHDLLAWVASVRAKKAEGNLAKKEKKVKKLEKEAQELADKNWLGALWSPIKYSARISWYRWREDKARAALERHQDGQERHENVRNEVLNIMANQFDTALKTHEARAQAFAEESDTLNTELDNLDAALSAVNAKIAIERNSEKREKLIAIRDNIMEKYETAATARAESEANFQSSNARAIRLQRIKNQILKKATRSRAATEHHERKRIETRRKTARAGQRRTNIPHHKSKSGEAEKLAPFEEAA